MAYRESRTPASKGKVLERLHIVPGEDGGHTVEHHYAHDGMTYHKPKVHVFGADEGAELMAHLAKHGHIDAAHKAESEEEE